MSAVTTFIEQSQEFVAASLASVPRNWTTLCPIPAYVLQEGFAILGERTRRGRCRSGCSPFRLQAFRAVQRTSAAFDLVDDNRHQRCPDATTAPP